MEEERKTVNLIDDDEDDRLPAIMAKQGKKTGKKKGIFKDERTILSPIKPM